MNEKLEKLTGEQLRQVSGGFYSAIMALLDVIGKDLAIMGEAARQYVLAYAEYIILAWANVDIDWLW